MAREQRIISAAVTRRARPFGTRVASVPLAMLRLMAPPPAAGASATPAARGTAVVPDPAGLALADVVSRLRRAMRRAGRAFGPGGALPGGLSVAQLEFLSCLAENPAARPGQVARLLRLAPSSVATLVNGLGRVGLVVRTGGLADRRTAVLELTPAGHAVVSDWQDVNSRILAAALTALPAASRRSLMSSLPALRQLTAAVDALADDLQPDAQPASDGTAAAG
jgi:DNA-binding MarR family transcriptional regulator